MPLYKIAVNYCVAVDNRWRWTSGLVGAQLNAHSVAAFGYRVGSRSVVDYGLDGKHALFWKVKFKYAWVCHNANVGIVEKYSLCRPQQSSLVPANSHLARGRLAVKGNTRVGLGDRGIGEPQRAYVSALAFVFSFGAQPLVVHTSDNQIVWLAQAKTGYVSPSAFVFVCHKTASFAEYRPAALREKRTSVGQRNSATQLHHFAHWKIFQWAHCKSMYFVSSWNLCKHHVLIRAFKTNRISHWTWTTWWNNSDEQKIWL